MKVITMPVDLWDTSRNALAAAGVQLDVVDSGPDQAARYLASETRPGGTSTNLTNRQREVLRRIAAGNSNSEIGRDLGLTDYTVRAYVRDLLRKLGARNRSRAVSLGYETGLLGGGAK